MHSVHGQQPKTTKRTHTVRPRRKNPKPAACSGCGETTTCRCLNPHQIGRELLEATRHFLGSGSDLARRREARLALADAVAREDQRSREQDALRAFCRSYTAPKGYSSRRDCEAILHMFGEYTGMVGWREPRSVGRTAELWHRPIGYMKELRDRALRAVQNATAAATATALRRAA